MVDEFCCIFYISLYFNIELHSWILLVRNKFHHFLSEKVGNKIYCYELCKTTELVQISAHFLVVL